jgi:5-oxoprolinase (ATP-hydrolysing) subunit A
MHANDQLRCDLNCDLGEYPAMIASGHDETLAELVTSLNIACGGHAGDDVTMRRMVEIARRLGKRVGAHPSYPDRAGFGRVEIAMRGEELAESIRLQVESLARWCRALGVEMSHVKPHGALYHAANRAEVADAIAAGVERAGGVLGDADVVLVGACGSGAVARWRELGFPVMEEAFADRRYDSGGTLRARTKAGAVISDPGQAAAQARELADGRVRAADETILTLRADTICIHGDTPNAVEIARAVRAALRIENAS